MDRVNRRMRPPDGIIQGAARRGEYLVFVVDAARGQTLVYRMPETWSATPPPDARVP